MPRHNPTLRQVSTSVEGTAASRVSSHRVWRPAPRPVGAQAASDASFTLEDDLAAVACEQLLSAGTWCIVDPLPGHMLMAVSAGFEALSGYTASEVVGKPYTVLHGAKTEPEAAAALSTAMTSPQAMSTVELTQHKKDGKTVKVLTCVLPLYDSSSQPLFCLLVLAELKTLVAADEAGAHKFVEQVKHYLGGACCTEVTPDGATITTCSQQLCAATGYDAAELAGQSFLMLAGPETSTGSIRRFMAAQSATGTKSTVVKMLLYKKNGSPFWSMVASCPMVNSLTAAAAAAVAAAGSVEQAQSQQHNAGNRQQQQQQQQHTAGPQQQQWQVSDVVQLQLVVDITASRPRRLGKYTLGCVLGQGASGLVRMGQNTATGELVAIKAIDATRFHSISEIEQVQEEMAVLAQLKHPNIIRLLEVHFVNSCFYFVMEYASGGSMAQHIYSQEGGRLTEQHARDLFGGILSALEYCHKRRVIHRDLKPENILMQDGAPKIADFGLAGVMAPVAGGSFTRQCGTPEFSAPEIVGGKEYEGPAVDLWSVGVMLYEALCGSLPFKGTTQTALFKAIQRGVYNPMTQMISPQAHDLVRRLLQVDPATRISWSELSRHPWLSTVQVLAGPAHAEDGGMISSSSSMCSLPAAEASSSGKIDTVDSCGCGNGVTGSISGKGNQSCTDDMCGNASSSARSSLGGISASDCDEELSEADAGHDRVPAAGWSGSSGAAAAAAGSCEIARRCGSLSGLCLPAMSTEVCSPKRSAVSFTSKGCHESVRLVIPDSNTDDDPITAAIKRSAETLAGSPLQGFDPCSSSGSEHCSPSGSRRAALSPATPGGRAVTAKSGLAKLLLGPHSSSRQRGSTSQPLPPVLLTSPTAGGALECSMSGQTGTRHSSKHPTNMNSSSNSSSCCSSCCSNSLAAVTGAATGAIDNKTRSNSMMLKDKTKSAVGLASGTAGCGSSGNASVVAPLPPIAVGKERIGSTASRNKGSHAFQQCV